MHFKIQMLIIFKSNTNTVMKLSAYVV